MKRICALVAMAVASTSIAQTQAANVLRQEVANKGWIAYSARTGMGDWDVFLCRPDGSNLRNLTNTPDAEEAAPRFSRDGTRMLYRKMAFGTLINHDIWGVSGSLVIADSNGANARTQGKAGEFPWASWSPNGDGIVCLDKKGIHFIDLLTKSETRAIPRNGIYQQLFLSPDGKWLTGTANHRGISWTVVRMNAETGEVNPVRVDQNCTPDWAPDSKRIIFSSRPKGQPANGGYGFTQLWIADGDGTNPKLIYGEDGFHIYGGLLSPDSRYVLFTKSPMDGGAPEKNGAPMHLMRLSDAPIIQGESRDLRAVHPNTNDGPVIELPVGWEPTWTFAEIGSTH
jgi:Tol biopolymer transport system component